MSDIVVALETALSYQEARSLPVTNSYFPPEDLITHPVANSYFPPKDRARTSAVASKSEGAGLLVVTINQGVRLNVKHPYVSLRVGSELKHTTTKFYDQNPVWVEEFQFTLEKPAEAVLWLTVCSASQMDRFLHKDVLGGVEISIADVVREKHMTSIYHFGGGRIHVELHFQHATREAFINNNL
ncbi:protein C2-DOMAIN ABA-RELATED 11-like [Bidens hawaiensis]|uniref:protein C2-DOMAIN ABA-RELATED 11-like n=1 Tax=Bidens hawaiensis TaxID=980011 RepID=UPI00404A314E